MKKSEELKEKLVKLNIEIDTEIIKMVVEKIKDENEFIRLSNPIDYNEFYDIVEICYNGEIAVVNVEHIGDMDDYFTIKLDELDISHKFKILEALENNEIKQ